jgi:hypothetical protein
MVIFPLKVLKLTNRGSQKIISPLAFAEGLFYFYEYFHRTEGFLNRLVVYNKQYIELGLFSKMVEVKKGVILNGR